MTVLIFSSSSVVFSIFLPGRISFRCPSLSTTTRPKPNPFKSLPSGPVILVGLGGVYPPAGFSESTPASDSVLLASAKGESTPATRATATTVAEARFLCFLVSSDTATQA